MPGYWQVIRSQARLFAQKGDTVTHIAPIVDKKDGRCELCGCEQGRYFNLIRNDRTGAEMVLGSRCIYQVREVFMSLGVRMVGEDWPLTG